MVESDQDQKTEDASEKRISEARDEGQLATSREMSTWFIFVAILTIVAWFGPSLGFDLVTGLRIFIERPEQISLEGGGLQNVLMGIFSHVTFSSMLVFGALLVMSVIGTMVQTDFYVNPARIKVDASKVFSLQSVKRLFSSDSVMELVKSFVKLVILGYIAYRILTPVYEAVPLAVNYSVFDMLTFLHKEAVHLIVILMILITVIAVADLLYVRFKYFKGLRMTKQEVKDEHKQTEGDPFVKGRLRRIRLEKSRQRMMSKVPTASVIVTNPTHYAVALHYEPKKMLAPVLVAKGPDLIAMRIRAVAEENDIPIVSNPPLARALYDTVDLDQPISPEHFRAVAEVISYVFKLKKKK